MTLDLKNHSLAFVDLETIGNNAQEGKIIDIGIIKIKNGEIVSTYNQLVNPGVELDTFTTQLTGIKNEDVKGAPTFKKVLPDVMSFLTDSVFVAHNVSFDYGFMTAELLRNNVQFSAPQLCTVRLSRLLFKNELSHSLDAIISKYGISVKNRHRAYDDAYATWEFFKRVTETFNEYTLNIAFQTIFRPARFEWKVLEPQNGQMSLF